MLENGLLLTELLNLSNIVSSKSEGRRMIEQNGISVNETKENDVNKLITTTDFNNDELIIQKVAKILKKLFWLSNNIYYHIITYIFDENIRY